MFDQTTVDAVDKFARRMKVDANALLAIAEIESAGRVFATVRGQREPVVRFEGHYFDARLSNGKRAQARKAGLAHPSAGGVKNPASQEQRWARLILPAMKIDRDAAIESVSWGLGQVMGAHWQRLGYASPLALVEKARSGAAGQIELMCQYIEEFNLADEIQRLDFTAFTRGYNGPGGIKAGYHRKMAGAYRRLSGKAPESKATGMLRMGSRGAKVRELQALLVRAGYQVKVDGDFGPATRDAVKQFQTDNQITVDGVAGPETMRALAKVPRFEDERPGEEKPLDVPEVKDAAKGGGIVALIAAVRDQIAETGSYLLGVEFETAQTVANVILAGSAIIGVGLAAWGIYGWWKSRQTDEGDIVLPDADPEEEWIEGALA